MERAQALYTLISHLRRFGLPQERIEDYEFSFDLAQKNPAVPVRCPECFRHDGFSATGWLHYRPPTDSFEPMKCSTCQSLFLVPKPERSWERPDNGIGQLEESTSQ